MLKKIDLSQLTTEGVNKRTTNIDRVPSYNIAKLINREDATVAKAVKKQLWEVAKVIDLGVDALNKGGRIIYIGAGTSGRLGVLDASEMPPTYGVPQGVFVGVMAGGEKAIRLPIEGAEDSEEGAVEDLKKVGLNNKDLVVGITASGRTPYVVGALNYANSIGAKTGSLATTPNSKVGQISNAKIEVEVGAEPISGSTRMKSGTAQKMVLNMISTGVMVKMKKVYRNLMVDVATSNEKLVQRAVNLYKRLTNETDDAKAYAQLKAADMSVKIAAVMTKKNVDKTTAINLVDKATSLGELLD